MAFSGHKMCGPMGIGVLWVNRNLFSELVPMYRGGGMIADVEFDKSTYAKMPELLEAGTPNVTGVVGLGHAVEYLSNIGMENIKEHEKELVEYFFEKIKDRKNLIVYGSKDISKKLGVIIFNIEGLSAHDVAVVLDSVGVAVRSGHHCVMPWHMEEEYKTTARLSFYLYNTKEDIDVFIEGLDKVEKLLK